MLNAFFVVMDDPYHDHEMDPCSPPTSPPPLEGDELSLAECKYQGDHDMIPLYLTEQ